MRALLLLTLILVGCNKPKPPPAATAPSWNDKSEMLYFGIPVRVSFSPDNEALANEIWTYLKHVDDVFNDYRADSEISQLNARQVANSAELIAALRTSQKAYQACGGAFDITVRPLRELWRKAETANVLPTDAEIAGALARCGMRKLTVTDDGITLADGATVDLGGIIKGIAVDHVHGLLAAAGTEAALVQIGGETMAFGVSQRDKPHAIGIQHPVDLGDLWAVVRDPGRGFSLSTSGNYRQPIVIDGEEYYHIFDPRTGKPVPNPVLSVSIFVPEPGQNWLTDSLATTGAVLGPERALALISSQGAEALILVRDGDEIVEHATAGWPTAPQ
ncbi:MAG: thiamine biosynthesis lipoprotein [Rhodothermales bacterium]